MAISDRTRKLLWGRSGNRCALCRQVLVAVATDADPAAIVGDECHIVARSGGGPRAGQLTPNELDAEDNLLLLCRVDHKRVDDQPNYFTVTRLRALKQAHEAWVHSALASAPPASLPIRIRKTDSGPSKLDLMSGGSTLLALVLGVQGYDFDHDDLTSEAEVDLVAPFLQSLHAYGEIGDELLSADRVTARYELGRTLDQLGQAGLLVYGARIRHIVEGGVAPPESFSVAAVRVKRTADMVRQVRESVHATQTAGHANTPPAA